jgi:hypothetical protein
MTFVDHDVPHATAVHMGVEFVSGARIHIRIEAIAAEDHQGYVLAAVHRDDPLPCGHVGRGVDEMRDFVARAFAAAGNAVENLPVGSSEPGPHCDGSRPVSDGIATVIDLTASPPAP